MYTGAETQKEGLQVELAPILYNIGIIHFTYTFYLLVLITRGIAFTSWE